MNSNVRWADWLVGWWICPCTCPRAFVRACVRACVHARLHARLRAHMHSCIVRALADSLAQSPRTCVLESVRACAYACLRSCAYVCGWPIESARHQMSNERALTHTVTCDLIIYENVPRRLFILAHSKAIGQRNLGVEDCWGRAARQEEEGRGTHCNSQCDLFH